MSLSANKGEWSEFYAFLKILSDKKIYSANEDLVLIPESFLNVLRVVRSEKKKSISYDIDLPSNMVHACINNEIFKIPIIKITSKLASILQGIKTGNTSRKGSFSLPAAEEMMTLLKCEKVKADSKNKADIHLLIEEPRTATHQLRGFSIKSKLGGLSTLLNASQATNIEYKIVKDTKRNDYSKAKIKLESSINPDETLIFSRFSNQTFYNNLLYIDSAMPTILSEFVKIYYLRGTSKVAEVTKALDGILEKNTPRNFYEYKIQELLINVALGMQPSKEWDGTTAANGGYIIVKDNGELACYHVYERDRFKKFLYERTKLETPSTSRHKFGKFYHRGNERMIKLNLQIRFV